jgi:V/A-type H+-transporting ATPase subunit A
VRLVGVDSLSPKDRLTLETARSIREDFLHQNAFHEVDTYASLAKQFAMLAAILLAHELALKAVESGTPLEKLLNLPYKERIARMKYHPEDEMERITSVQDEIRAAFAGLAAGVPA